MGKIYFIVSLALLLVCQAGRAQVTGTISEKESKMPLSGVSIYVQNESRGKAIAQTDIRGAFALAGLQQGDTLYFSRLGFTDEIVVVDRVPVVLQLYMVASESHIEEVEVNTGYYRAPMETMTGSVAVVGREQLNRAMGSNLLERLEGLVPGVQFVNAGGQSAGDIRIRGLSTIESDETPLIVVDNFPYDGDINHIDPSTVESITVLKDAAAAAIWGAKAGNGVLVITTKKGKGKQGIVSFNISRGWTEIPDLTYSPTWLPSGQVMEIEKQNYEDGQYDFADNVTVPLYVDYLRQHDDGQLTSVELEEIEKELKSRDIRRDAMEYLYRTGILDRYNLSINGGSDKASYTINGGIQDTKGDVVGNGNRHNSFAIRNMFRPHDRWGLQVGAAYSDRRGTHNGISYPDLTVVSYGISPYLGLRNGQGEALAVPRNGLRQYYLENAVAGGLLDWQFRPLDEIDLVDRRSKSSEWRLNGEFNAELWRGLEAVISYQYTMGGEESTTLYDKESFYVRNLVNTFTQSNMARIIPYNGIYDREGNQDYRSHYMRGALTYNRTFGKHRVHTLAGMDIRSAELEILPGSRLYDYDSEHLVGSNQYNYDERYDIRPSSRARIPKPSSSHKLLTNRDLSYFSNVNYGFNQKYNLSASLRWDGSNLFGVKTNQKGVPLWSVGGSWKLDRRELAPLSFLLSSLRIKASYGITGNVNKNVTHYPTIRYQTDLTGMRSAYVVSVGNPSLRWEKVYTFNTGLEWESLQGRLSGSIEYYNKNGTDLIGDELMDPTVGIIGNYKVNYADIRTEGFDIGLGYSDRLGGLGLASKIFLSLVNNRVGRYNQNQDLPTHFYTGNSVIVLKGKSRDQMWSFPWYGLSSENGYPQVMMDGELSQEYTRYYTQYVQLDGLIESGVRVPPVYGSWLNTLRYKGLEVSALLTWKWGYVFRRGSMMPGGEFMAGYHRDYNTRWVEPGDELRTDVPAYIAREDIKDDNVYMATLYARSQALVTAGDHIRIQDISFRYLLPSRWLGAGMFKDVGLSVQGYVKNLGILWRRNSQGIDPDYADALYRAPRSYNLGFQLTF